MPKFYVQSGEYRRVLNAKTYPKAVITALAGWVNEAVKANKAPELSKTTLVSEVGFCPFLPSTVPNDLEGLKKFQDDYNEWAARRAKEGDRQIETEPLVQWLIEHKYIVPKSESWKQDFNEYLYDSNDDEGESFGQD